MGEVRGDQAEVSSLFLGIEWAMRGNDVERSAQEVSEKRERNDDSWRDDRRGREMRDKGKEDTWARDVREVGASASHGAMRLEAGSPPPSLSSSDKSALIVVDIGKGLFRRAHLGSWSRTRTDLAQLRVTPGHEGIERGQERGFCIQVISGHFALRLRSGGGMMMHSHVRRQDHQWQQAWSCGNCLWDQQENDL
ncbi:hypothetical protein F5148DRAFT_1152202 [Russula earlei]|uniref:Uncharacterized protein n=1 Tax=Russula earlei TaxID=71964 RepID=A0ACC0TY47_9AGAM|nr:hypothetical protein F5148DRAFT_1152202 [Russula earlei]